MQRLIKNSTSNHHQKLNGQPPMVKKGAGRGGAGGWFIKVSIAENANKCRRLHASQSLSPSPINCKTTAQWRYIYTYRRMYVCMYVHGRVGK